MGLVGAAASILVAAVFYGDGRVNRSAQDLSVNNSARSSASLRPALLTLSADPIGDTEIIQIVRVRMPRTALVSAGLLIETTDSGGLVDVDLLVGEDGLPRDIRGVQRVVD